MQFSSSLAFHCQLVPLCDGQLKYVHGSWFLVGDPAIHCNQIKLPILTITIFLNKITITDFFPLQYYPLFSVPVMEASECFPASTKKFTI
jgi:hypothetical protein